MSDLETGLKAIKAIQITNLSDNFEDWFQHWITQNEMVVTYKGQYSLHGRDTKFEIVRARMFQESRRVSRKFSYQDIDASLLLHHDLIRENYLREKLDGIAKSYEPNDHLKCFVRALCGKDDQPVLNVFQHFIWQVKRKLLNLPVENHMMPVICGTSGSGKSEAVRKLLQPLEELSVIKQLDCFKDERQYSVFSDYYVVFLDEMAKGDSTDFESMKNIITAPAITWRPLYTNRQMSIRNHATFIGTSNYELDDIIKDPTSSRRWFAIKTPERCDWDAVNKVDYQLIWKSVNAYAASPILESFANIRLLQEASRYKTDVELFIEDIQLTPTKGSFIPTYKLYERYTQWIEENGLKPQTSIRFTRILKSLNFIQDRHDIRGERKRGFLCVAKGFQVYPKLDSDLTP